MFLTKIQNMQQLLNHFQKSQLENQIANSKSRGLVSDNVPIFIEQLIEQYSSHVFSMIYSLNISNIQIEVFPSCIKVCQCLQELNISANKLMRLPSLFITTYFPYLKILDVSDNYLYQIQDIIDLGALHDLELLQCLGNPLPRISSLTEFAESLLFHPNESDDFLQTKIQRKKSQYGVFLEIGSYWTVKNQFIYQLSNILKANDYVQEHSYLELDRSIYEKNELSIDQNKLSDGSLCIAKENEHGDVGIELPGCFLVKDQRLEAPIVVLGKDFERSYRINSLSQQQIDTLYAFVNQNDGILQNTSDQDMVSRVIMKFGFFGQNYFCYNLPFKKGLGLEQVKQNDRKISTVEFINKKVQKDIRIMTSTKQARLDYLKIDVNTMLPSEIQQKLKHFLHENHYFTNMNQRQINVENAWFPRLRLLNGSMITVDDYDKALSEHNMSKNTIKMMQAAAFHQCQTKIPHNMLKYAQKDKVGDIEGMAAEDLKKQTTHVTQIKPLSEEIKKKQIYERLVAISKKERQDALQDLRDFITFGQLKDDDHELQFGELLKKYDNDDDDDLDDFMEDCRRMADHYKSELDEDIKEQKEKLGFVGNVFTNTITSKNFHSYQKYDNIFRYQKPNDLVVSKFLDESNCPSNALVANSIQVEDLSTSHVELNNEKKNVSFMNIADQPQVQDIDDAYDEMIISRTLQQTSPSKGVNQRDYNINLLNQRSVQDCLDVQQTIFGPQRKIVSQQQLEASLLQSQLAKERSLIRKSEVNMQQRAGIVQPQGMKNTLNITEDEAIGIININKSVDPIQHVIRNTQLYVNIEQKVEKFNPKSKIVLKPKEADISPLDKPLSLEAGNLDFHDVKTIVLDQQYYNPLKSVTEDQLKPDFNIFLKEELKLQHQANNNLMIHMSKSIDRTVKDNLQKRSSMFKYTDKQTKKTELRHSTLLDIIKEGDQLSGNPNGLKLNCDFTGKIRPDIANRAQEILRNELQNLPTKRKTIPESKQQTLFNPIQPTSAEIMDAMDERLARQDLQFETDRIKMVYSNNQDGQQEKQNQQIMKQLMKQNNQEIQTMKRIEMQKKHKANLQLIQSSQMHIEDDVKQAPSLFQYAQEVKQLQKIQLRNDALLSVKNRDTTISDTYVNPQLRYMNVNDQQAIQPISVKSRYNAKMFGTNMVQTLNVPSVEEAAQHAALLAHDIPVNELIEKSSYIMQNSQQELASLQQYQKDFYVQEAQYDANQMDPLYLLLKDQNLDDDQDIFDKFKRIDSEEKKAAKLLNLQTIQAHQLIESVTNDLGLQNRTLYTGKQHK